MPNRYGTTAEEIETNKAAEDATRLSNWQAEVAKVSVKNKKAAQLAGILGPAEFEAYPPKPRPIPR